MKKALIIFGLWYATTIFTLLFTTWMYTYDSSIFSVQKSTNTEDIITLKQTPYNFYTSLPQILGAKTVNAYYTKSQDVTPDIVYEYLKTNKSPMVSTSNDFVAAARKYDIDPIFMLSIAQCESNLGKKMPHKTDDIYECHNPFGWGIHKGGTLCFESWQEGYEAVAKGLRKKYYDDGLTNPEEIMVRYTPPALEKGGSWAKCVNFFMGKIDASIIEIQTSKTNSESTTKN